MLVSSANLCAPYKIGGRGSRCSSQSPPPQRKLQLPSSAAAASAAAAASMLVMNKDIPPELQGVSVKELVKVIGESRANGNGVTPPDTPRRQLSRSVSPAVAAAAAQPPSSPPVQAQSSSRGSSPRLQQSVRRSQSPDSSTGAR